MNSIWIPIGIASAFCSAMVVICDKMGTQYIDSTIIGIIQTSAILLMLVGTQLYYNNLSQLVAVDMQALPYILAASFFTGISYVCYYLIINYTTVPKAASLNQFTIIFTIYLAMIFLGDTIAWQSILGSILMVLGMGFMVL